jgi:hypothetical protein
LQLNHVDGGIVARSFDAKFVGPGRAKVNAITISLGHSIKGSFVALPYDAHSSSAVPVSAVPRDSVGRSDDVDLHKRLLGILAEQALVRRVELPPIVEAAPADFGAVDTEASLSPPRAGVNYPVVGIIDGGVGDHPSLTNWSVGDAGLVPSADKDPRHGAFIAGLVAGGGVLNPHLEGCVEPDGCKFFDLDIFPRRELRSSYYDDIDYFFDIIDEKVKFGKEKHGVRVFNLSFGLLNFCGAT